MLGFGTRDIKSNITKFCNELVYDPSDREYIILQSRKTLDELGKNDIFKKYKKVDMAIGIVYYTIKESQMRFSNNQILAVVKDFKGSIIKSQYDLRRIHSDIDLALKQENR